MGNAQVGLDRAEVYAAYGHLGKFVGQVNGPDACSATGVENSLQGLIPSSGGDEEFVVLGEDANVVLEVCSVSSGRSY